MSKRINLSTMSNETISALSDFNVSTMKLRDMAKEYKEKKSVVEERMVKVLEERKAFRESNPSATLEEVLEKYPMSALDNEMRALEEEYAKETKPYKDAKKSAVESLNIDKSMYLSYALTIAKGDASAKGKVELGKGKNKVTYVLDKTFTNYINDVLEKMGVSCEDEKQVKKFAQSMSVWCSGAKICTKGTDYIQSKTESQFVLLFINAFLQYTVNKLHILDVNEDYSVSRHVFDAE